MVLKCKKQSKLGLEKSKGVSLMNKDNKKGKDVNPEKVETVETRPENMDTDTFPIDASQAEAKRKDTGKAKQYNEPSGDKGVEEKDV